VRTSAATLFIIAASMIFGWIVVVYRVADKTLALLSAHIDSRRSTTTRPRSRSF